MISSASVVATWRSASRSVWTYCFMVNATSAWPIRLLSAFQSIVASRQIPGPVSADLVGVLELVPVTRHDHLQDQHRLACGVAGGHARPRPAPARAIFAPDSGPDALARWRTGQFRAGRRPAPADHRGSAHRLSPHIITNIDRILAQLLKWAQPQIDAYLRAVGMAAEHSGGGIVADVPRTVHDCPDHEDNLILDLTAEVGAVLIVSNDTDLLSMSPWRGTPIIEPAAFAAKADAMRRHARRRRR
jgi:hypothetical protein